MVYLIFLLVCFLSSAVGTVCGIGGGVIIKPVLDAFGVLDVAVISFLSGCTVLSMTTYSVVKSKIGGTSYVDKRTGIPLALGAALGGVAGKELFSWILEFCSDKNKVGAVQAVCLLIVTAGTFIYTIYKKKIRTLHVTNRILCAMIGMALGIMSSFLGIGGGPINLVVLYFFFSMQTKAAVENSLYIIFFSQIANLVTALVTGSVPEFSFGLLILMVFGGISGGVVGRALVKKIEDDTVDRLFMVLMGIIILINIYNIYKFTY